MKEKQDGEDGSYAQLMLALIEGILSIKTILKSWQLCLLFKLYGSNNIEAPTTGDHELLSASHIILYMFLITYTL